MDVSNESELGISGCAGEAAARQERSCRNKTMFHFFYFGWTVAVLVSLLFFLLRFITIFCSHQSAITQRITEWKYYFTLNNSKQNWNYFCHVSWLHVFYSWLSSFWSTELDAATHTHTQTQSTLKPPESHRWYSKCSVQVPSKARISPHPTVLE